LHIGTLRDCKRVFAKGIIGSSLKKALSLMGDGRPIVLMSVFIIKIQ
jgi:hypothetical protein